MKSAYRMFWTGLLLATSAVATAQLPNEVDGQALPSLAPLVERVSPAVVNIRVSQTLQNGSPYADEMFRRFFGLPPDIPGGSQEVASAGSGVIVDADQGYILTNNHVVEHADEIQVFLYNDESLEAEVIGTDPATDIAVIKIDPQEVANLVDIPLGDSEQLRVGDFVIAIGNPFGLGNTVTSGIVSALGRTNISQNQNGLEDFIQTDASINPGNSGGALVNMRGELVGINSAIFTRSGGNIGIGFAVPTEIAGSIMKQILDYGEVRRGLLGVTIATINPETAKALGAVVDHGALVADVQPDSAADKAGLKVDDIIVEVNDERIDNNRDLANAIGLRGPGEQVEIKYLRGGDTRTTTAELGEATLQQISGEDVHPGLAGAQFSAASTTRANGIEVSDVAPRSPAGQRGLQPGDVIIAVNRVRVNSVEELQEIAAQNEILFLLIRREGRQLLLQIR
jgi:Do/DeqQ family serine protease